MRRMILAATTGALLLTGSACGSAKSDTTTTAAAPAASAATVSASPSADYTADTKKVCAGLDKLIEGKKMQKFVEELAKQAIYREANATESAKKARVKAGENLKAWGEALNEATAAAKDPELRAAGEETLANMTRTAGDDAFFAKIKSEKDIDRVLKPEFTAWLVPLATFCE
ncbi:nucleotide exchange factor GrpE [Couchioplanes azureus]|uniref:hypothetical protein n=1 Tax=Couchioplanes caeruleus TaxID=56438 RepID=UPI00166FD41D|nr:hypothetical protein [Couchioplanes caeruleus]GGQ75284.1 hypothetical protein GCM10010166_51580 [Couchioplanes caeruleus subsp. azureus]